MNSLSPPQWIKKHRRDLKAELLELTKKWESTDLGASESIAGAVIGEATMRECANELRKILEK